jgi:hypothetical protein
MKILTTNEQFHFRDLVRTFQLAFIPAIVVVHGGGEASYSTSHHLERAHYFIVVLLLLHIMQSLHHRSIF